MTCGSLIKRGNLDVHRGKTHVKRGRGRGDASANRGTSKIDGKPPEARREAWNRVSLTAHRRSLADTLISDF